MAEIHCKRCCGLAFVKNLNYWPQVVARIMEMKPSLQNWFADQLAMAGLINAFRTITLPVKLYNWTPYNPEDLNKDLSDKWLIHFKGKRKHLMIDYAKRMEKE